MSILNRAYARGVADTLIREYQLKVASLDLMEKVADHVGDHITFDPTVAVHPEHVREVATAIYKIAAEEGALITGDNPEQQNDPENAAVQVGGLAAMEQNDRPEGTYLEGVGQTALPAPMVGTEVPQPAAAGNTGETADNSVNKNAAFRALLRKLAMDEGALITGDKPEQQNTPENAAAQVGGLAALDQQDRPEGKYVVGVGNTTLNVPAAAHVGVEAPHPSAQANDGVGASTNSIIEASKAASADPYLRLFEMTARKTASVLPARMPNAEKIATIKQMMGMTDDEQRSFLAGLTKSAAYRQTQEKKADLNVSSILSEIATLANLASRQ